MKGINCQHVYDVDPAVHRYIAANRFGNVMGFRNPPIRDYDNHEWIDSVDGSSGELLLYSKWDVSVKKTADISDSQSVNKNIICRNFFF